MTRAVSGCDALGLLDVVEYGVAVASCGVGEIDHDGVPHREVTAVLTDALTGLDTFRGAATGLQNYVAGQVDLALNAVGDRDER